MTAHKHVDMITAKARNMDLVAYRKTNESVWREVLDQSEIKFKSSYEYFLCLPQHKEACLHLLNGGKCLVSYESVKDVYGLLTRDNTKEEWDFNSVFMNPNALIQIKPKKEKRWIVVTPHGVAGALYLSVDDAKKRAHAPYGHNDWQFIEIEVEV